MKALLTISCIAVLVLFGISVIIASGESPIISSSISPVVLTASLSRQPVEPSSPSPGVYSAAPYSMIVVIPEPVDSGMVVAKGDASLFTMPCIKPETRLERR
ncbi:MAG TPA: hypothetical protein VK815_02465 [Candidatus Acidoferrales bacterium]|nr:hypothetical protein [Candidatus Acidoferrales bacterium]